MLDGGAPFYHIYKSMDKKYFAVGCIEPQFFKIFLKVRMALYENLGVTHWWGGKKIF